MSQEAEKLLLQSRGNYYEYGDKASRLLAHQLRHKTASHQILQIKNKSGTQTSDPNIIKSVFRSFYSKLYTYEFPSNSDNINQFLNRLNTPTIAASVAAEIDAAPSLGEVRTAIKALESGKSPFPRWITP